MAEANLTKNPFPLLKETSNTSYEINITTDPDIIDQAFSLRYKVFNLELGEGLTDSHKTQRDVDQYDAHCDHLVIIDKTKNLVVGTYRILTYDKAVSGIGFYAETEFNLENIYKNLPRSVEIGRCCVHAEYRSGLVMNLLWYGLATYMKSRNISHLFGCTSLNKGDTHEQAALNYKICETIDAIVDDKIKVSPQPGYEVQHFDHKLELPKIQGNPKRLLPSLMRGYLSVGVKIGGEPAYDPIFDVIDFFTIFDYQGIAKAAKRFFK